MYVLIHSGCHHLGVYTHPGGGVSICADVSLLHLYMLLLLFPTTREKVKVLQGHMWSTGLTTVGAMPVS